MDRQGCIVKYLHIRFVTYIYELGMNNGIELIYQITLGDKYYL